MAICSGIAALIVLVLRVRDALRRVKAFRSGVVKTLGAITAKAELAAAKAESAGDTRELQESVARLRRSIAQLAVLRAALERADTELGWVRALL